MLKRERLKLIEDISKVYKIPMSNVEIVIDEVFKYSINRVDVIKNDIPGIDFGILPLDNIIKIHPGILIMYSQPDGGKTSFLKTIVKTCIDAGLNVIYYDAENKLYLHELELLNGAILARTYRDSGMKEIIKTGLIDVIIVDTITSIFNTSQWSFIHDMRGKVPYIVLAAQMRTNIPTRTSVPACDPAVLSSCHTSIYFTSKESFVVEGVKLTRAQWKIVKYEANRDLENSKGSLVIYKNMIDILYTAYDILRSRGIIIPQGSNKTIDNINIGNIKDITAQTDIWDYLITRAAEELRKEIWE